jgi:hypothetical protein
MHIKFLSDEVSKNEEKLIRQRIKGIDVRHRHRFGRRSLSHSSAPGALSVNIGRSMLTLGAHASFLRGTL